MSTNPDDKEIGDLFDTELAGGAAEMTAEKFKEVATTYFIKNNNNNSNTIDPSIKTIIDSATGLFKKDAFIKKMKEIKEAIENLANTPSTNATTSTATTSTATTTTPPPTGTSASSTSASSTNVVATPVVPPILPSVPVPSGPVYFIVEKDGAGFKELSDTTTLTAFNTSIFPVKITRVASLNTGTYTAEKKGFVNGTDNYEIEWGNALSGITVADAQKAILTPEFIGITAVPASPTNPGAGPITSTTNPGASPTNLGASPTNPGASPTNLGASPTTTGTDNSCIGIIDDIQIAYNKETKQITSINDFCKYIPTYLLLNDMLVNNKSCLDDNKTTKLAIHTIMNEIYMMPINNSIIINDTEVNTITDINTVYSLLQFVNLAGDYVNPVLTLQAIQDKLKTLTSASASASTSTTSLPTNFKVIAPANASSSCWLNSAMMAYLVPLYQACGTDVNNLKQNVLFTDNQLYIVDLIHKYIDAHFDKTDRSNYKGDSTIRQIKEYIVKPTVVGVLDHPLEMITPDGTNNHHTFLSDNSFKFSKAFNEGKQIKNVTSGNTNNGEINVVPLKLDAKSVSIADNTLTIDTQTYEIPVDIRFITFNNEARGEFGPIVQAFLQPEIKVNTKEYEQVSFMLASGGHYVVVVKSKDKYYMIDDLPPTIKEISEANVTDLINKRNELFEGYYVVGIVYMLKDDACNTTGTNVADITKMGNETTSAEAQIVTNKADFVQQIANAIKIYSDTTTVSTTPQLNKAQLENLKKILQRIDPTEYTNLFPTPGGGSRKNRSQKSKKTKRKYYVYNKEMNN